ncbi:hypothetical protein NECAME_09359 [Necator americanus]|uniref:Uncharacterized protein n=1 Tax=Necator americanus TaxID=51031 RepID=W2TEY5_NECAM|nr:hypothetical protein NECAME_09359 [Necator americanus]ETN80159.1 hypothetical protein NECAME_09359 [Necator americanus]
MMGAKNCIVSGKLLYLPSVLGVKITGLAKGDPFQCCERTLQEEDDEICWEFPAAVELTRMSASAGCDHCAVPDGPGCCWPSPFIDLNTTRIRSND